MTLVGSPVHSSLVRRQMLRASCLRVAYCTARGVRHWTFSNDPPPYGPRLECKGLAVQETERSGVFHNVRAGLTGVGVPVMCDGIAASTGPYTDLAILRASQDPGVLLGHSTGRNNANASEGDCSQSDGCRAEGFVLCCHSQFLETQSAVPSATPPVSIQMFHELDCDCVLNVKSAIFPPPRATGSSTTSWLVRVML